jgi:hypothetical protein
MGVAYYITLSNPLGGEDDVFNEWYTNIHIVDVLKIPGVISAQRFRLASEQRRNPPYEYRYLAIYKIDDSDIRGPMEALRKLSGTPLMPVSETFDPKHLALVFEPITPEVLPQPGREPQRA